MKSALVLVLSAMALPAQNTPPSLVEGLAASPVRVLIYEDLECSDSAHFRRMLDQQLLPKYADKVAFIHHDFPLAKHAWARRAAIAARFFAARSPELGLAFQRYAMAGQELTSSASFNMRLSIFAHEHGIPPDAAIAALSDPRYGELVDQDHREGVARGVSHTPTVFVNGQPFIETFTFAEISKGIDQALAQAR